MPICYVLVTARLCFMCTVVSCLYGKMSFSMFQINFFCIAIFSMMSIQVHSFS
uniref:Uncharacterized protein n=1 Tax=Arundo donax TaxID=35708 RepID=A0A0A9A926_ARUDO